MASLNFKELTLHHHKHDLYNPSNIRSDMEKGGPKPVPISNGDKKCQTFDMEPSIFNIQYFEVAISSLFDSFEGKSLR